MPAAAKGKHRSMTFTGCWTCKSRKVKCDELRPGCQVCAKARITCSGYGIKLQWISDQEDDGVQKDRVPGRMRIQLGHEGGQQGAVNEVDKLLDAIDKAGEEQACLKFGPFSTFTAQPNIVPESQLSHNIADETSVVESPVQDCIFESFDVINFEHDMSWQPSDQELVIFTPASSSSSTTPSESPDYVFTFPSEDIGILDGQEIDNTIYHFPTSLFSNADTSMLMHHYINHIPDLLQPVLHAQNPWRTSYIPTALEGSSSALVTTSLNANSPATLSLFHALLAEAAFHLRGSQGSEPRFQMLGNLHRQRAIESIRLALSDTVSKAQYKNTLMAIMSIISIDIMDGSAGDFSIHLEGSDQLRKSRHHSRTVSRPTQQLNELSAFLSLLARTSSSNLPSSPWPSEGMKKDPHIFNAHGNNFEFLYGITTQIVTAIYETCQLAQHLSYYQPSDLPSTLLSACEALGDRLEAWTFESETVTSIDPQNTSMMAQFRHHACAFHRAARIYYYRVIQHCDSAELGADVEAVAQHLHALEDLKDEARSATLVAPITWAGFIASCEAVDRAEWSRWWGRVLKYRIGNIERQWEVVRLVWSWRDEGCWLDWREILQREGIHVLPI